MTGRYVSTPERAALTPRGALLARLNRLLTLEEEVHAEVLLVRSKLRRLDGIRGGCTTNIVPADVDPGQVRAWARSQGWRVADRGRLSTDLITAYLTANPGATR